MNINFDTDEFMYFVHEYMAHHDKLENKKRFLMTTEEDFLFVKNRWESIKDNRKGHYPQWAFDFKAFGCILSGEYELTHNIAKMLFTTNIQEFIPVGKVLLPNNRLLLNEEIKDFFYILTKSRIHANKKFSNDFIVQICPFFNAQHNHAARNVLLHSLNLERMMLDDTYYPDIKNELRQRICDFLLSHQNSVNKKMSSQEEISIVI